MSTRFGNFFLCFSILLCLRVQAQFAPAAGWSGSTAIAADSSVFVAWATACQLQRGYLDIAMPDSGFVNFGDESAALGLAGENGIVSLGDGGVATLTFSTPIFNGLGFDFAVFENGFAFGAPGEAFLEFAFVEVSSNGLDFYRFPAFSDLQNTSQIPMTGINCSQVHNLAGKYIAGFGTPFDLEDLVGTIGLDVNNITHVRLVDVVGSINEQYATYDAHGRKINDPYPTPFPSGGFDLDAVGVIHASQPNAINSVAQKNALVFPNPVRVNESFTVFSPEIVSNETVKIVNSIGLLTNESSFENGKAFVNTSGWVPGLYFLSVNGGVTKFLVQ